MWLICTSWDGKLFLAIFVLIIVCIHITCLDSWIMHYSFFLQRPYILCSNAHNVLWGGATGSLNSKFKLSKFIANATKLCKCLADEHLRKKKNCTWAIQFRLHLFMYLALVLRWLNIRIFWKDFQCHKAALKMTFSNSGL